MAAIPPPQPDPNADLGFGSVVSRESRKRLLNRDGTFNVRREGLGFLESLSAYHYFLTISWRLFLTYVAAVYVVTNALFALGYMACGPRALSGFANATTVQRFFKSFFFSVHTLATIGYGNIVPANLAANFLVAFESLVGLLAFSVIAGVAFARIARPAARILFSRSAVIAPYRGITAFMFRMVNTRSGELVDLRATVLLARRKEGAPAGREFLNLELERKSVSFFPLSWTVVHPIDEKSPIWGQTAADLHAADAEFLVLLNGFDETFSQTVHTRSSYKTDEVIWGAKFKSMFNPLDEEGTVTVDIRKIDDVEATL
jgi:inward rectifier potassium channel